MKKQRTALGVHIYAGGFTCGVKQAGFNVLGHFEDGTYGVASAKLNWPELPVWTEEKSWPTQADYFAKRRQPIDLVYCNPPCAIFSSSTGRDRNHWRTDPRSNCWRQCLKVFFELRPRAFVLESITQAWTSGNELVLECLKSAMAIGYSANVLLIDSKWFGLPQSRRRFFMVLHEPHKQLECRVDYDERKLKTAGDALSDKRLLKTGPGGLFESSLTKMMKYVKPGEYLREVYGRLDEKKIKDVIKPGFMPRKIDPTKQMGAFLSIDHFAHPTENRFIGLNEAKLLCGYPLSFKLEESSNPNRRGEAVTQSRLLARAVLPPVGKWIAEQINSLLNQEGASKTKRRPKPVARLHDLRKPNTPIEEIEV